MEFSCDVNPANIFFLEQQNKITVTKSGEYIYKFYNGKGKNRNGWLFPTETNIQDLNDYISNLLKIDKTPNFVLLTATQKPAIEKSLQELFAGKKVCFESDAGDSDYIYCIHKMADLPGKDFQKKRNHVSKFLRTYGENWKFEFYAGEKDCIPDFAHIQSIYKNWKQELLQSENDYLTAEEKSISLACNEENFRKYKLIAGVLFISNEPVAFIMGSFTTAECINAHFEKCLGNAANNGALAVLNQQFAIKVRETFPACKYLNREEDLNITGLRKSKLSYKPEFLLEKYFTLLEECPVQDR